jgi:dipeptidyl aminopeptidase/acylaminoacyl peptidase
MALTTGTRIGPYEIVALLGAGGMGEVYRARDSRLAREVAVKVLPELFASDPDRMRRFEQEARAAGQINHPNIMAVYDVGEFEGTPYIVSEFIQGQTLREVLGPGPLPVGRAIRIVIEIATGLAAAHQKGIVHRDLKPENVILLADDRIKILDFGIAKLTRDGLGKVGDTGPTLTNLTVSGQLLGTASYMAPEQIRDHGVVHRTDLFTLGAMLYEMVTGMPAFPGDTVADRISAILRGEPPALPREIASEYPGLAKVLRRTLEKSPDLRLDSARDLALALELVHETTGRVPPSIAAPVPEPDFQLMTFREGEITGARFTPDGQTVVYSAAWDGKPTEIYVARVEMPESRAIGIQADLLSVAPTSELAVLLDSVDVGGFVVLGTLGRVSMMGGRPRRVIDNVTFADWSPDGRNLAVVREQDAAFQLEYPVGRVLHRSSGWISHVRVSRDGKKVAIQEHPALADNGGHVVEVDLEGRVRKHPTLWATLWGLAWSSRGTPVASGQLYGSSPGVYEILPDDRLRTIQRLTGYTHVDDVSSAGDMLFTQVTPQMKMEWHEPGEDPRDLTWLDWTLARDVSPDGKWILFDETGLANRGVAVTYMRATDGSPPIRLGEGLAVQFSPDLRWALVDRRGDEGLVLLPTGAGHEKKLGLSQLSVKNASWSPDGRTIYIAAQEAGHTIRLYRYDLSSGGLEVISGEGFGSHLSRVSPDGRFIVSKTGDGSQALVPLDGSPPRVLEGILPGERTYDWSPDSSAIFAFERGKIPARIFRVDVATGKRELWHAISPRNPSGVSGFNSIGLAMDGRACVGSYMRSTSELYIARGAL